VRRWLSLLGSIGLGFSVFSSGTSALNAETVSPFPDEFIKPVISISVSAASLSQRQVSLISRAASASGATATAISFPFVPLTAHTRDGKALIRLKNKWRIPFATMVAPSSLMSTIGGPTMAEPLERGEVLMGVTSAKVRSARVGDVVTLRDLKFSPHQFVVGAIVPDAFVDDGDITMSDESAKVLGNLAISTVMIADITSLSDVMRALRTRGIRRGPTFRFTYSWDTTDPDAPIGTAITKSLLGEFSYRPTTGAGIQISSVWLNKNIMWNKRYSNIGLQNNCHKKVVASIQGALNDISKAGLSRFIDLANSNRYGGCFVARYNRRGGVFGSPTRHAWGMALDVNTVTNAQGSVPQMNCSIVRIFRKWGFAWGGNFPWADGMHFEYVGERRDQIGFPSKYCPNRVPVVVPDRPSFADVSTTTTTAPIT
jgi:hypothetical protein